MSDQKGGTHGVYVDLMQLLFQLSNSRVSLKRLSKSVLANFLVKHVTAVTRVAHADTVIETQSYRSKDDAIKSVESCCTTCRKRATLDKLRRECTTCGHRLSFHCLRCDSGNLNYNLMLSHLRDRMIFYCSKCGFYTTKSWELKKHTEEAHKKKLFFQCRRCDKTVRNFAGLRSHENYCGKVAKISCTICGRKFKLAANLEMHARRMHLKTE